MNFEQFSQFSESDNALIHGDAEQFTTVSVASKTELMDELQERGADLIVMSEALEAVRTKLGIPTDIAVGLTFIRVSDAADTDVAQEFMDANPDSLGFCFSRGFELEGKDTLEVFIAIDPERFPVTEYELTDAQVEQTLDLNHYLLTQIMLALDPDDAGVDAEDALGEEQIEVYEEKAMDLLEELLEAETPIFAIVPHDGEDEED